MTSARAVTPATLLAFFIGRAEAIWSIAQARGGLLLGTIFVFSAALAREYDRSDLISEPHHLLLPFAASLISSLLLYGFVRLFAASKGTSPSPSYLEFLQVYWATAPLAWLYAFQVEKWLNEPDAVQANFWILGIVAVWRVVLMIRTLQTLWGADSWSAGAIVLAFGDVVLILAMMFSPAPVLDVMAGNRLSDAEKVQQEMHLMVSVLAWLSILVWLIGLALAAYAAKWNPAIRPETAARPRIAWTTWLLGIGAIGLFGLLAASEQPKQRYATLIRRLIEQEDYYGALGTLADLTPENFPPHRELPPNPNFAYEPAPPRRMVKFFLAAQMPDTPAWVRQTLMQKVVRGFVSPYVGHQMVEPLSDDELELLVRTLEWEYAAGMDFPYSHHGIPRIDSTEKDKARRAELLRRLEKLYQPEW